MNLTAGLSHSDGAYQLWVYLPREEIDCKLALAADLSQLGRYHKLCLVVGVSPSCTQQPISCVVYVYFRQVDMALAICLSPSSRESYKLCLAVVHFPKAAMSFNWVYM